MSILLPTIIVTFSKNVIIAEVGQQTFGLEDTRVSSLVLLQCYKPKLTLNHHT